MQVGIAVVKSVLFRGVQQEFSNVYHYRLATAVTAPDEALLDIVVGIERDFHATTVNFLRGSVWSSGGTKAQNAMRFQKALSGTGNQGENSSMDRERAFLIRWRAGLSSTGKPVYLRKYYHSCGAMAGQGVTSGVLQNRDEIPLASRQAIQTSANRLSVIHADLWRLCAASGRELDADNSAECHRYLEHHQLGDMWR